MGTNCHKTLSMILLVLFLSGCASFAPRLGYHDLMRLHQPDTKQKRERLVISAEQFISTDKSRKAFDSDVARYGVLALFLHAENQGIVNYQLRQEQVKAFLGDQRLTALSGNDAARQAALSEPVGKALAWTAATGPIALFLWPVTVAGSGSHTQGVNREIEGYFEHLELGNVEVKPHHPIGGFLYFKLPDGVKKLEKLRLEVIASEANNKDQIEFKLSLPPIELARPVSLPDAPEVENDLQE